MRALPFGIFQGDAKKAEELRRPGACAKLGVKGVLCVADDIVATPHEVPTLFLPLGDRAKVTFDAFEAAVNFYDKFNPIFIYCKAGVNRSRVLAAALLLAKGVFYKEALELAEPPAVSMPAISLRQWHAQLAGAR